MNIAYFAADKHALEELDCPQALASQTLPQQGYKKFGNAK